MTRNRILATLLAALIATSTAACGGSKSGSSGNSRTAPSSTASTQTKVTALSGAGSSLVYPLVSNWIPDYQKKTGVTVTYGPVGSGGGIQAITSRTVDFGASDAPLTPDQAKACNGCVQIPWALSATTLSYNIHGAPDHLKLDASTIAGIFLGTVKTWNDPQIAKLNPAVTLPAEKITPVFRSDGSGDTYAFTSYLSRVSTQWKTKVGASTQVNFPTGVGGKGNSGVSGVVSRTEGAIGYISVAYTVQNHLKVAAIKNAAGRFVPPTLPGIAAAAAAMGTPAPDNSISIVDPPASAADAYPIATFTYAIVPKASPKAQALKRFLTYAIGSGQRYAAQLVFARLPAKVRTLDQRAISSFGG